VFDPDTPAHTDDSVADLAGDVLTDLYRAVCGHPPKAVRAYHDDDALLLLLRFDPYEMTDVAPGGDEQLLAGAFIAMPGMVAAALEARTGRRLAPGNLSVCAERGLAVFAFTAADAEPEEDDGEVSFEAALEQAAHGWPALRVTG